MNFLDEWGKIIKSKATFSREKDKANQIILLYFKITESLLVDEEW